MTQEQMKKVRIKRNLSQRQVAIEIGVSEGSYRNWELGACKPSTHNRIKLIEVLGGGTDEGTEDARNG